MPTFDVNQEGECLCQIAQRNGFKDCLALRALPANQTLLDRPLKIGDVVTLPDLQFKEVSKPPEKTHKFKRQGIPPVLIRFVHGSPDKPYREDPTSDFLNVSNFVTDRAGRTMNVALPTPTVFNQVAHDDPDTFKIEIVDPTGPAQVSFELEALKPLYNPAGVLSGHERFPAGAVRTARSLTGNAVRVPSGVCYRSPYLRLVVDDADKNAVPNQTLLVTDTADGANGDADRVEILDQLVQASYTLRNCPAAAPNQCRVTSTVPIAPDKQRIHLTVRIFRTAAGGAATINGITIPNARLRTMRWFRRLYAQAGLGPKFVGPEVELIDPPSDNMLVVSQATGRSATGLTAAAAPSNITFTLSVAPGQVLPDGSVPPDVPIVVLIPAVATPLAVAGLVAAAVNATNPGTFTALPFTNPRAFSAPNPSADVLITRADGLRVVILNEQTNDVGLGAAGIQVARVNLPQVNVDSPADSILECSPDMRRVLRSAPCSDDRLDFFVVGGLFGTDNAGNFVSVARGIAVIQGIDVPVAFQPPSPIKLAALMGRGSTAQTMDATDGNPFSYPHEAGHVLHDGFHTVAGTTNGATEMMTGDGTSGTNAVRASKRICDEPVHIRYNIFDPSPARQAATPGADTNQSIAAVPRIRTNGAPVLHPW